jgi:hypothetical protein
MSWGQVLADIEALEAIEKNAICWPFFKPSDGLEPSTPSLPSSDDAGTAGKGGKPRVRKSRKKKESAEGE